MSEFGRFEQSDELVNIRGEHIARTFGLDLDLALSGRFSVRITVRVQKLDRVSTIRFVIVVLTVLVTYDRSRARPPLIWGASVLERVLRRYAVVDAFVAAILKL